MIKHIVFFGLAENAEGKSKAENAQIIKSGLESLIRNKKNRSRCQLSKCAQDELRHRLIYRI
jgi:hypothetical protein